MTNLAGLEGRVFDLSRDIAQMRNNLERLERFTRSLATRSIESFGRVSEAITNNHDRVLELVNYLSEKGEPMATPGEYMDPSRFFNGANGIYDLASNEAGGWRSLVDIVISSMAQTASISELIARHEFEDVSHVARTLEAFGALQAVAPTGGADVVKLVAGQLLNAIPDTRRKS